jgi:transposase
VEAIGNQVQQILSAQFMKRLLECEIARGTVPTLSYRTNTQAFGELLRTELGKTILFTDNEDWSNEQIVLGYRAQSHIESAFRDMKNPHFLGWSPLFHWTDSKILVHAFYCVLALMLSSLLQRSLYHKNLDLSIPRILELLGGIQQTTVIFEPLAGARKPRLATCLSKKSPEQQTLFDALDLKRFAAA